MSAPERPLRVGVTLSIRDEAQSIWENGIFQNVAFLVQLFALSSRVGEAVIVAHGTTPPGKQLQLQLRDTGIRIVSLEEAVHLDAIIEMSALLPLDWVMEFRRRGGRYAWMRVGNDYVIDVERAIFGKPPASLNVPGKYHAVWTLPQYKAICSDYFQIATRAPVKIVPHLWSPLFLEGAKRTLPEGTKFEYRGGRVRWRVCTFEPNICTVKTAVIPMLICELAYRHSPGFLEYARICNTLHMKDNQTFYQFARSLEMVKHGACTFESRYATYEFMANFGDCIVSHQWENSQNYLYYEALHAGYPLIHNSDLLKGYGYYYPAFDAEAGARALLRAHVEHDLRVDANSKCSREFLWTLHPSNQENIETYTRQLLDLWSDPIEQIAGS